MAPYVGRPTSLLLGEATNQCILLELPCGVSALSKRYHGIKGGLRVVEFGRATYLVRMNRITRADRWPALYWSLGRLEWLDNFAEDQGVDVFVLFDLRHIG